MDEMPLPQKWRRGRQCRFHRYSGHSHKGRDVVFAGGSEPHNFRIDELFPGKPGSAYEPPDTGMKPEHRRNDFFNNGSQPVSSSNMKQFVTRDAVLPCGIQTQKGLREENNGSNESSRCRASDFLRNAKLRTNSHTITGQPDGFRISAIHRQRPAAVAADPALQGARLHAGRDPDADR